MYVNFETIKSFLDKNKGTFTRQDLLAQGFTEHAVKTVMQKLLGLGYLEQKGFKNRRQVWQVVNRDVLLHFVGEGRIPLNVTKVKVTIDRRSIMKSFYSPSTTMLTTFRKGALDAFSVPSRGL